MFGFDAATVRMDASGRVTVLTGVTSPGGGNDTGLAQVVAGELGLADAAGVEAYVVGGYVRDKLLGKDVTDIDILSPEGITAGFQKLYADRYASKNIRLNSVLPGFMDNWPASPEIIRSVPMARAGRMHEVAKTVAFLLSEDAGYITGQNILVDGGVTRAL